MFRQICSRLQLSTNAAVQQWASASDRGTNISVGLIMEQRWHNQIIFGSGVVGGTLWELKTNGSASGKEVVLRSIPKFEGSVSFAKNDMSDLQSLPENHYCVSDQTNFPTVDSFAALRYPFCDLKNNELCLVGFQMTTGEKKHLKVVSGRRIRTKFQELCKETLNTSVIETTQGSGTVPVLSNVFLFAIKELSDAHRPGAESEG